MNELLWLLAFAVDFGLVILLYRFLGRLGLFMWIPFITVLANIQVLKVVELGGFQATLGNVAYASLFLVSDIISENYGRRWAGLAVLTGFVTMLLTMLIMGITLQFRPAEADFIQESLQAIFRILPRIAIGSMVAYVASQSFDVFSYDAIRRLLPARRWLWVRNNVSTFLGQLLDTVIFASIAFWGVFDTRTFISIVWTTYALKLLAAVLDTPFIYLARHLYDAGKIRERL